MMVELVATVLAILAMEFYVAWKVSRTVKELEPLLQRIAEKEAVVELAPITEGIQGLGGVIMDLGGRIPTLGRRPQPRPGNGKPAEVDAVQMYLDGYPPKDIIKLKALQWVEGMTNASETQQQGSVRQGQGDEASDAVEVDHTEAAVQDAQADQA